MTDAPQIEGLTADDLRGQARVQALLDAEETVSHTYLTLPTTYSG